MLRALRIASKKNSAIDGVRVRIYKAGTKTYNIIRPKNSKNIGMIKLGPRSPPPSPKVIRGRKSNFYWSRT